MNTLEEQRAPAEGPEAVEITESLMYDAMSAMDEALRHPCKINDVVYRCDDYINDCMPDAMIDCYTLAVINPNQFRDKAEGAANQLMKEFITENWADVVEHFGIGREDEE